MSLYQPLSVLDEVRLLYIAEPDPAGDDKIAINLTTVSLTKWSERYRAFRRRVCDYFSITAPIVTVLPHPRDCEVWARFQKQELGDAFVEDDSTLLARFTWGDYETLSYTWGPDAQPKHTIFVNGSAFVVGESLYLALARFREEGRYRPGVGLGLWVDAICLNQADHDEKSMQVKRMRDIFAWSKRSVIWLGDRLPWIDEPSRAIGISVTEYAERLDASISSIMDFVSQLDPKEISDDSSSSSGFSSGSSVSGSGGIVPASADPDDFLGIERLTLEDPDSDWETVSSGEGTDTNVLNASNDRDTSDDEDNYKSVSSNGDGSDSDGVGSLLWEWDPRPSDNHEKALKEIVTVDIKSAAFFETVQKFITLLQIQEVELLDMKLEDGESWKMKLISVSLNAVLAPLFTHHYWGRVWVMQELMFSSASSVVYIGDVKLQLGKLMDTIPIIISTPGTPWFPWFRSIATAVTLSSLVNKHQKAGHWWCYNWTDSQDQETSGSAFEYGFAPLGVLCNSTIPADKLFGILGLIKHETASRVVVDYAQSSQRVARDATLVLIQEMGELFHLFWSRPFDDPGLPSWAVDLTQGPRYPRMYWPSGELFHVCEELGPWDAEEFIARQLENDEREGDDWKTLVIYATQMDTVDGVTAFPDYEGCETSKGANMAATHADFSLANTQGDHHSYSSDEVMLSELSKFIGIDFGVLPEWTPADLRDLAVSTSDTAAAADLKQAALFLEANVQFRLWTSTPSLKHLFPTWSGIGGTENSVETVKSPPWLEVEGDFRDHMATKILGQCKQFSRYCCQFRLITTSNGWLGYADRFVKTGDKICLLEGSRHELAILRPFPGGFHEFIGIAKVPRLWREMKKKREGMFEMKVNLR